MKYRLLCLIFSVQLALILPFGVAAQSAASIVHHDLSVTISPADHRIACQDRMTIRLSEGHRKIGFLLNQSLDSVRLLDSAGHMLHRRPIHEFAIDFRQPLDSAEVRQLNYYEITPAAADSIIHLTLAYEGIIYDPLPTNTPEYARGFATTSGLIDTQGVYLAGSSAWIPTQKNASFTFKLRTTLPSGWLSISQGQESERIQREDRQINEWISAQPMTEIYLVAGRYVVTEENHRGIRIATYLYHDDSQLAQKYLQATRRYLDLYSGLIGAYPYPKFALVENFWQTGYGMPSFTLLGSDVIRLPFMISTSYGHEILHNWWGNGVFVDYATGNWCEGLTNYLADHYYKKLAGDDISYRRTMLQSYLDYVQDGHDFPLTQFSERSNPASQAIGYNKAAMVFHMLCNMLGEEKFMAALRSFWHHHRFRSASWNDIEAEFAHQAGTDLHWFFNQWLERSGAPRLKLKQVHVTSAGERWKIAVTLLQQEPVYRLKIPIQFSAGRDTMITVTMSRKQQTFVFQWNEKPRQVRVDPGFDVFRYLDRSEIPPALSQTMGAKQMLIVLPSEVDTARLAAYQQWAQHWKNSVDALIRFDQAVQPADLRGRAIWILDSKNRLAPQFIQSSAVDIAIESERWRILEQEFPAAGHSFVLTGSQLDAHDFSWTIIHIANSSDAPSIGRKLPHYGKYGYLVFKGTENILKGEWVVKQSPLNWTVQ
ncbi:MAG: M1 family aminopeptidase [candidate division KSB1 bacterium]|nr:M1 family aminopeptidase [candidate division KSB1 bacterium]